MKVTDGADDRPLVLVVDDFEDGRQLVVDVLTHYDFDVAEAATGMDALDMTRAMLPDVVVLDLALPGLDGWEVARRLKADRRTRGIRLMALTAHAEPLALQRASEAGCDLVMTKPCPPDDLVQAVRALIADAVDRPTAAKKKPAKAGKRRS